MVNSDIIAPRPQVVTRLADWNNPSDAEQILALQDQYGEGNTIDLKRDLVAVATLGDRVIAAIAAYEVNYVHSFYTDMDSPMRPVAAQALYSYASGFMVALHRPRCLFRVDEHNDPMIAFHRRRGATQFKPGLFFRLDLK